MNISDRKGNIFSEVIDFLKLKDMVKFFNFFHYFLYFFNVSALLYFVILLIESNFLTGKNSFLFKLIESVYDYADIGVYILFQIVLYKFFVYRFGKGIKVSNLFLMLLTIFANYFAISLVSISIEKNNNYNFIGLACVFVYLLCILTIYFIRGMVDHSNFTYDVKNNRFKFLRILVIPFNFMIILVLTYFIMILSNYSGFYTMELRQFNDDYIMINFYDIYSLEKTFVKDDKTIVFTGMFHVASKDFYDSIKYDFDSDETIILSEGIRRDVIFSKEEEAECKKNHKHSYQQKELLFGYVSQLDYFKFPYKEINADVNYKDLDPDLRKKKLNRGSRIDEKTGKSVYDSEIVDLRNSYLFDKIQLNLYIYNNIIVPWGAGHGKGIEKMLFAEGFEIKNTSLKKIGNIPMLGINTVYYLLKEKIF